MAGETDLALLRPLVHQNGIETAIVRAERLFVAVPAGYHRAAQPDVTIEDLRL